MAHRTTAKHNTTFVVGQQVKFRGSGEGPYSVVAVLEIPDGPLPNADPEDAWPRDGVGHHQHVTLRFDELDGCGISDHVYSGAWLELA